METHDVTERENSTQKSLIQAEVKPRTLWLGGNSTID